MNCGRTQGGKRLLTTALNVMRNTYSTKTKLMRAHWKLLVSVFLVLSDNFTEISRDLVCRT